MIAGAGDKETTLAASDVYFKCLLLREHVFQGEQIGQAIGLIDSGVECGRVGVSHRGIKAPGAAVSSRSLYVSIGITDDLRLSLLAEELGEETATFVNAIHRGFNEIESEDLELTWSHSGFVLAACLV